MQPSLDQLEARARAIAAATPEADPEAVAVVLLREVDGIPELDHTLERLGPSTRRLFQAHGRWPEHDSRAAALAGLDPASAAVARFELVDGGLMSSDGTFSLTVRAWRRLHHPPDAALVARAADAAEESFHRLRYAGAGDPEARAEVERWGAWGDDPEVAQWAAIAREEHLGDAACERCRAWDALEASRDARWRDWNDQAARWLERAEAAADSPRARFFIRVLRAIRAVQDGEADGPALVDALEDGITDEGEWFFVFQARSTAAGVRGGDPRPHLRQGIELARRMGLRFREAHLRVLLGNVEWPDAARMRQELERIDTSGLVLTPRDQWNFRWIFVKLGLAQEDLQGAAVHARAILEDPDTARLAVGGSWAVVCLALLEAGELVAAGEARKKALHHLIGGSGEGIRAWLDRVWDGGSYFPLPPLHFASAVQGWLARTGERFQVAGGSTVELSRSPVSVAILRELALGPRDPDALIEAAWPGDASSYPSLKARLHTAVRALRRRGLDEHLVFHDGVYRLEGLELVD